MKIDIPQGKYIKNISVNAADVQIDFSKKKKVALVFISLNDMYWPYLCQVIKDCRQNFLPQHNVDYFAWTDYHADSKTALLARVDALFQAYVDAAPEIKQGALNNLLGSFATTTRLYECFYPQFVAGIMQELSQQGLIFKREANKFWVEMARPPTDADVLLFHAAIKRILVMAFEDMDRSLTNVTISETAPIEWPAPTLMRYHLFLNQEEKLKEYDYIFYLDADMRVVAKISDEILGEGLTAAEHPMYSLRKEYIPPYEPNSASTAYIKRPGKVLYDEHKKPRFRPFYYAGGFQGGVTKDFLKAMHIMKENIDKDFNNNYVAIWNDESHWNKYLSDYKEPAVILSPSYVYPDSLIKEYYEPRIWGCSYEPKIITLTKPFSLSTQGAEDLNKFLKQ